MIQQNISQEITLDPSEPLCNLDVKYVPKTTVPTPPLYSLEEDTQLVYQPITSNQLLNENIYVNKELFNKLRELQNIVNKTPYNVLKKVKNIANPFEEIGNSIFMNRAAVKLANIDAIYNISQAYTNILVPQYIQDGDRFTFCALADAPGGFTEYLQYKRPGGRGYGISLEVPTSEDPKPLKWRGDRLDITPEKFQIPKVGDGTGNLYTNAIAFIQFVKRENPTGVSLVVADGGFSPEDEPNAEKREEMYEKHEMRSSRLILSEVLTALGCLSKNGVLVLKLYNTYTEFTAQLLYLLAYAFNNISIIKPISSRPTNEERYLVGIGRRNDADTVVAYLKKVYALYKDDVWVTRLIQNELPSSFQNWLIQINDAFLRNQVFYTNLLVQLINSQNVKIPRYNLSKALLIWKIPDNAVTYQPAASIAAGSSWYNLN